MLSAHRAQEAHGLARKALIMGELTDKAKGVGNDVAGKAKAAVGKATDDPKLRSERLVQQVRGAAHKTVGDVKGKAGDKI